MPVELRILLKLGAPPMYKGRFKSNPINRPGEVAVKLTFCNSIVPAQDIEIMNDLKTSVILLLLSLL